MRKLIAAAFAATLLAVTMLAVTASPAMACPGGEDPACWSFDAAANNGTLQPGLGYDQQQPGSGGGEAGSGGGAGGGAGGPVDPLQQWKDLLSRCTPLYDPTTGSLTARCNSGNSVNIPEQSPVSPRDIAIWLMSQKTLPKPGIGMNPRPGDDQLVNIPGGSWLWIEPTVWHDVTASVSLPGLVVSITATPVSVAWRLTDGPERAQVDCNGPGTPYNPSLPPDAQTTDCSYTFHHAAGVAAAAGAAAAAALVGDTVTATITWEVRWSADGAIRDAGFLANQTTGDSVTVRVVQAQSVNAS